jgi:hypothetical protein
VLEVVGRGVEFVGELRCELGAVIAEPVERAVDILGVLDTPDVDESSLEEEAPAEEAVRASGAATDEQAVSVAARATIVARLITACTASTYWPSERIRGYRPLRIQF